MCKYRLDFSKNSFCLVWYMWFSLKLFLKLFFCIKISWCSWLGLSKCTFLSKLLFYIKLLESRRIFIHDYCSRLELIELSLHRLEYSPPYCAIWPLNLSLLWFFFVKSASNRNQCEFKREKWNKRPVQCRERPPIENTYNFYVLEMKLEKLIWKYFWNKKK